MSGVIIKGMKMPGECRECRLSRYFSTVGITICVAAEVMLAEDYKPVKFEGRYKDCPLVEVKEEEA